jgi:hypothetical protein
MNAKKCTLLAVAGLAVAAISVYAIVSPSKTFRTTGYFIGVTQGSNSVTGNPQFDTVNFAGRNLVNLAMGRSVTATNVPNQVMALTFACDLSSASLVVYDLSTSNVVNIIAPSTSIDSVKQQDTKQTGPNRARFVGMFQIAANGTSTNGLLGGYLTVAGHVHLNPTTGCPEPVLVRLDRDVLDAVVGNKEIPARLDPDSGRFTLRAGLAHLIGVVDAVDNGKTNTILVPYGGLSIRRELPVPAPILTSL